MKIQLSLLSISFFLLFSLFSCQPKKRQAGIPFKGELFNDTHLHEIRLYFNEIDFWDSLVKFKKQKDSLEINRYLKCDVSIDGKELKDIGLRFKGESSYDFTKGKKKSFKLDLNHFIRKQKYGSVSRINLNNNYKDPSLLREKLALATMIHEGLPAPQSAFAKVFLNDEYWGVYLMVEEINKDFLKRNFGEASGNLYIGEPNGTLEKLEKQEDYLRAYRKKNNKKKQNWNDLKQFINVIHSNNSEEKQMRVLDSIFNVDNCLKTFAINNLLVNVDAYNMMYPHNYFLYQDSTSKKIQWINYDYNYAFAAWNPKLTYKEVCDLSIYYSQANHPLADLMLNKNKLLKQRYFEEMKRIVADLNLEEMEKRINTYHKLIQEAVLEDNMKEFTNEEFEKNRQLTLGDKKDPGAYVPGLLEFLQDRTTAVKKQIVNNNLIH